MRKKLILKLIFNKNYRIEHILNLKIKYMFLNDAKNYDRKMYPKKEIGSAKIYTKRNNVIAWYE